MKLIRTILLAGLVLGTAAVTFAAPPSKRIYTSSALRTAEEFQKLKAGDTIAMVCKQCDSVTVQTLESTDEAMKLCKEGETVVCGSCTMTTKVVRHGPRSKAGSHSEIRYENEKGEECMFVAKLEG